MDNFPELELVDYGCFWKRVDNDTMNWWIFERRAASGADGDLGRRGDG
jgi:hypothetical protein